MNIEEIREYCLVKPHVTEEFPFDESTLVFKVADKVFLLCGLDRAILSVNLKCDPEKAVELREEYIGIKPGYHMNKKHWNTVELEADVPSDVLESLINHSYAMVINGISKKKRTALKL